jgi:uncharacterized Zn finger protein
MKGGPLVDRCLTCGSDDVIIFSDAVQCQRCGSVGREDGWEYDPSEIDGNIQRYDDYFED